MSWKQDLKRFARQHPSLKPHADRLLEATSSKNASNNWKTRINYDHVQAIEGIVASHGGVVSGRIDVNESNTLTVVEVRGSAFTENANPVVRKEVIDEVLEALERRGAKWEIFTGRKGTDFLLR